MREYQIGESYMKREIQKTQVPLEYLAEYWSALVCEETTQIQGKNCLK